jgi:NAD+ kinase
MLIQASSDGIDFDGFACALNEASLHKKDTSSMVSVKVEVDGTFMNNYWADGLIIATPTGSTAYSLSCGGPIVVPGSENFSITPIAPHNLNVRPMVLSSSSKIKIKGAGRDDQFFFTLDSRSYTVSSGTEVTLEKAPYSMHLLHFEGQDFFSTIRNKMLWGIDKRN